MTLKWFIAVMVMAGPRESWTMSLLQHVCHERAHEIRRRWCMRIVVGDAAVAAAPRVPEPIDEHQTRENARARAPFARGCPATVDHRDILVRRRRQRCGRRCDLRKSRERED